MGDAGRDLRGKATVRRSFTMVAMGEKYASTYGRKLEDSVQNRIKEKHNSDDS